MTIVLGIDPGVNGAIAFLTDDGDLETLDIPTQSAARGKSTRKRTEINAVELARIIDAAAPDHAIVEAVGARPHDGSVQAFAFGKSFGIILGILAANFLPITLVTPQVWRKALGVAKGETAGDKRPSMRRATELFPEQAFNWAAKCNADRAEAALIAEYGRRLLARAAL